MKEIIILLDSHKRKEESRAKEVIARNYNLASMIAGFVGRTLNGKHLPELEELYPALVSVEQMEAQQKQQEEREALRYKMKFMNFAMNANAQRAKRGGATTQ